MQAQCSIQDCPQPHLARGWCNLHYRRWRVTGDPLAKRPMPPRKRMLATIRFWAKVNKTKTCWFWLGARDRKGYGVFWDGAHLVRAHRFSYQLYHGTLPPYLDHICRIRHCVNHDHLESVTHAENLRRGISPTAINSRKVTCPKGHPYDRRVTAGRRCRECDRETNRRHRAKCAKCGKRKA